MTTPDGSVSVFGESATAVLAMPAVAMSAQSKRRCFMKILKIEYGCGHGALRCIAS
jgi:hypothetical protein